MITLKNIALLRGTKLLFENTTLSIFANQKIGLIGINGSGKSSLFALLRGELEPSSGDVFFPSNFQMSFLSQELPSSDLPAIEYIMRGDRRLETVLDQLKLAEKQNDLENIAHLHHELYELDGYKAEAAAAKILNGLGFGLETHYKPVNEFSGGWQMRLNLAKTLMSHADLILLDEPTNHLDLDAIIWLENYLKTYEGAVIVISHDREFLDNTINHIWHIEHQKITLYAGNYSNFEKIYAQKIMLQQSQYKKQQAYVEHMMQFINRFRAKASKAKQVQSRLKALDRLETVANVVAHNAFTFEFEPTKKLAPPLLTLEHVDFGYEKENIILKNIDFAINPEERIGLLGRNGMGKTTLMKLLAKKLAPQSGDIFRSRVLRIGYFAQHQMEQLIPEKSPLEHLKDLAKDTLEKTLRDFLGSFAFSNEMALTPIKTFSGGEKARLVLAMLVFQKPNLLLLDEPTNHLDIDMREALMLALQTFTGSLILVSHDRHLLRMATDTLYLVHDQTLTKFNGDLDDYKNYLLSKESKVDAVTAKEKKVNIKTPPKKQNQTQEKELLKLEKKIETLYQEKQILEKKLASPEIYEASQKEILENILNELKKITAELKQTEDMWFNLQN